MPAYKKGPWTVLQSRTISKNPWMEVRQDKVIQPDGKPGTFTVAGIKPGVAIVALDKDKNVYLVKEYKYGVAKETIETIAGGIEKGQTKLHAAKRELLEETGLEARKWKFIGRIDPFTAQMEHSEVYLYLAEDLIQGNQKLEGTETLEVLKMPLRKALKLIENGTITCAASIIGLTRVAALKDL